MSWCHRYDQEANHFILMPQYSKQFMEGTEESPLSVYTGTN